MSRNDFDVIVIGGGPAGNTVASYLAKDGYKVTLLEKDKHPRHRIGESLLPSMMPILTDFGLIEECERRGFTKKPGATFTWGKSEDPWHLKWKENPFLPYSYAFHVDRASFDEMLSNYAKSVGVTVQEETKVLEPIFADSTKKKIVGVKIEDKSGSTKELYAKIVVDASGSASVIGKNMSTRVYDEKMRQVAIYTYFDNVAGPDESEAEEIREHIIITTCPKGWFWWIPINSKEYGYVSCGLVTGQEFKDEFSSKGVGPEKFFFDALEQCPRVKKMIGANPVQRQPMRTVMDWSYSCEVTAGDGFFLCGDAAAFLDPLISTGVSLAMLSAYSASICINTILKEPHRQADVVNFYQRNYRQMYEVTRDFLHYFYAGATSAYTDELFWKGRSNLKMGENVGAKQAFTYFTAIIPSNPHPAIAKQISLFKNMMSRIELPEEKLDNEFKDKAKWEKLKEVALTEINDQTCLVANGQFEKSFTIDEKNRRLVETWGISYDSSRPVLSNTASWLMGQNFYAVDPNLAKVLQHLDGKRTMAEVRSAIKTKDQSFKMDEALTQLCEQKLVLKVS